MSRDLSRSVDLRDPVESDNAFRIALAWRELRRGASASAIRDHFFGTDDDAIEQGQMDALDVLVTRPHWRMSELADALRVDPSTATRAVQRLVNDGLAERHASDHDGRVVLVAPSDEGRRQHAAVARRRIRAMKHLLAEFEPEERRTLADLLERFTGALDRFVTELGTTTTTTSTATNAATDATTTPAANGDAPATDGGSGADPVADALR